MILHFYVRRSLKTPQNNKLEDHVLEKHVSGILSEHRAQSAAKISLDIKNKKWFETLIHSKVFLTNKKNARLWAQKTFLI